MKRTIGLSLVACFAFAVTASAANLKSGPQAGEAAGPFNVKKVTGNKNDNVAEGQELCYRCMLGGRPVVAIFARTPDEKLTRLMKEVDTVVGQNKDSKKMAAFVNLLGDDKAALEAAAKKIVEKSGAENIAVVIPTEQPKLLKDYKLSPDADTTVLIYVKGKVVANHAFEAGKLDDKTITAIVEDTSKILN